MPTQKVLGNGTVVEDEEITELLPVEELGIDGEIGNNEPVIGFITIPVKLHRAYGQSTSNTARFKFQDTTLTTYCDEGDEEVEAGRIGSTVGSEIEVGFNRPDLIFRDHGTEGGDHESGEWEMYNLHSPAIFKAIARLVTKPEVRKYIKDITNARKGAVDKKREEDNRKHLIDKIEKARKEGREIKRKLDE